MTSPLRSILSLLALIALGCVVPLVIHTSAQTVTPPVMFAQYPQPQLARQVWPGDFNGDGRTDLIAGAALSLTAPTNLVIETGRGDGTFSAPRLLGIAAEPLAVADMNNDGKADLVVRQPSAVAVLPGQGTGNFGAARVVFSGDIGPDTPFAIAADFNGDGKRDVVLPGVDSVRLYPGRGDFTFDTPVELPVQVPVSAISADFNGDGRRDLAVAEVCCGVDIFLNQGGMLFSPATIPLTWSHGDIATGDLNRDGALDLVVTMWTPIGNPEQPPGRIAVLLGRGNGTFATDVEYQVPNVANPYTVVVGDFTRDGILDVATGNQSIHTDEDLGVQLNDSITIWRGDGTGKLTPAVTFSLGAASVFQQHQLNTNDFNRDGYLDLISSPGVVLLNSTPFPNRAPSVFAGPDVTYDTSSSFTLDGQASDPDGHWLTFAWTNEQGQVISRLPKVAPYGTVGGGPAGVYVYTLTATDEFGASASDSITINILPNEDGRQVGVIHPGYGEQLVVDVPYRIQWGAGAANITRFDVSSSIDGGRTFVDVPGCTGLPPTVQECVTQHPGPIGDNNIVRVIATYADGVRWIALSPRFSIVATASAPLGLLHQDIGPVQAAGSATFDGTTYTIKGSGADIWGTADEFHYAYRFIDGDFIVTTHVASVQNVNQWTKAGLMLRSSVGAGARHVSIFTTPGAAKGFAMQTRHDENGVSTQVAQGLSGGPGWLKLVRQGYAVTAYAREEGMSTWVQFGSAFLDNSSAVLLGFAVTSHVDGQLATATFDHFTVEPRLLPWQRQDIGAVGVAGSWAAVNDIRFNLRGSGADIWGTADAFSFRYLQWDGDGTLTARIWSIDNTNAWAKAGVMFRETLTPGSKHVMAIVSPGKGLALQYRASTGGSSAQAANIAGTAPKWIRLQRTGNTFTASTSVDYLTWTTLGSITVSMNSFVYVGVPVTSHNNTSLATADVDDLSIRE